ncbi:MAG TPA: thiamine biosynthesis protein ThiS [Acidobacteriota bacterium]|nr:thiamine biosynthesis protein ThiS [Acidobacteriota bacterium]
MASDKPCIRVVMTVPERKEWEFRGRHSVEKILRRLELNPESVIVIHGDTLLTPDEMVENGMEIEVRSAISGGAA